MEGDLKWVQWLGDRYFSIASLLYSNIDIYDSQHPMIRCCFRIILLIIRDNDRFLRTPLDSGILAEHRHYFHLFI